MLDSEIRAPNHRAGRHGQPSAEAEAEPQRNGDDDLNGCAAEGDGADRLELAKRQLEPEREQQQRHAEFGKLLDVVDVDDREPAGEWTDDHACEHVPDHQGLTEALR